VAPQQSFSSSSPTSFAPASGSTGGSFRPPSGGFTAPVTPIVQPALEPQEQAPSVPEQPLLAAPVTAKEDDTGRGVAFIVLLAGLALAGLAYLTPAGADDGFVGLGRFRRPAPASATLPSVAGLSEPVRGGLGRFARTRTAPPQTLS
jgi:hypothetical protein